MFTYNTGKAFGNNNNKAFWNLGNYVYTWAFKYCSYIILIAFRVKSSFYIFLPNTSLPVKLQPIIWKPAILLEKQWHISQIFFETLKKAILQNQRRKPVWWSQEYKIFGTFSERNLWRSLFMEKSKPVQRRLAVLIK